MRKLLNTLYVQTEGAYLHRDGLNVVVAADRVEKLRVNPNPSTFMLRCRSVGAASVC